MNSFSISQLEQFSGIKPHTIRMWEKRYNALSPIRSDGNTRYYDGEQLKRLLNISYLNNLGYKISKLGHLADDALNNLIVLANEKLEKDNSKYSYYINQLIIAGTSFDENLFNKTYAESISEFDIINTFTKVIYPLLDKIGILWSVDSVSPAHEHFLSNLIKQKLYVEIDKLPSIEASKETWLLFLPENEFHEIGLLLSRYIILKFGIKVIYLSSDLPFKTISNAVRDVQPTHLLLFFIHYNIPALTQEYLNHVCSQFENVQVRVSGHERLISQLNLNSSTKWIKSVDELISHISLKRN